MLFNSRLFPREYCQEFFFPNRNKHFNLFDLIFRLAVLERDEEYHVYKCLTCACVLPVSVCPSLSSPYAGDASSRAPSCSIVPRHPKILCPPQQTPPAARPPASGEAGLALPRASLLYLPANPKVNPKEKPIYSHVSLGKAGVSQRPQHLTVRFLPSCEAVAGSESTCCPSGGKGDVLVCLCPLSVSKAHAIRRNNIFIHLHDNFFPFFFFLFMGFTEMKSFKLPFLKILFRRYHVS